MHFRLNGLNSFFLSIPNIVMLYSYRTAYIEILQIFFETFWNM